MAEYLRKNNWMPGIIASVNRLQYLVSCNFKHINKLKTKNIVQYVNLKEGYQNIVICRPEEVVDYDDESEDE
jgi:hypothetical protein